MTSGADNTPPALRLRGITKRFGPLVANDDIDLDLNRGEILALLGENGAGKTTLMNILFGQYTADQGGIEVDGQPLPPGNPRAALAAGLGMVHQHFTLAENLTVLDNILLGTRSLWSAGLGRRAARARLAQLGADYGLSVDPDRRIRSLSVGERQRVEILKALWRDARILILDEPTAVLTPQESQALFATLRRAVAQGMSIIFISHKLNEVTAVSDRVAVLRHGRKVAEIATRDTDRHRLAALMVGAEIAAPDIAPHPSGPAILRLDRVSTETGHGTPLREATLDLCASQITGLAGVSGNGQAALAGLIGGSIRATSGRMTIEGAAPAAWSPRAALDAGVARIPEDRHATGTIADFSLTENAVLESHAAPPFSRRGILDHAAARAFTEGLIKAYDIRCPGPDARIRLLSGGNMQKLVLGRALAPDPRIVVANQPVRGLDIGAVGFVQRQLIAARDRGAAVLLISEDLDEIMALSDVIHVIAGGRISPPFPRGTMSAAEIGLWMAGHGFDHAA
ncbi:ABC transporter ATP-binding protein [Paracoccus pacificus]|uniref:ABC transporter ATP-binding protein n=1 Tax=Paracoccus pacificus TaxID=1463598 RepID=A0ABW4R6S8_9RHOB